MPDSEIMYCFGFRKRDGSYDLGRPRLARDAHGFVERFTKDHPNREFQMKRRGSPWGKVRLGVPTYRRYRDLIPHLDVGDTLIVQNSKSQEQIAVRIVDVAWKPDPMNTAGTPGIDLISGALWDEFERYGPYSMGICANKPGQHFKCNAHDVGTRRPQPDNDDGIHRTLREMANWLRVHGDDLPILGIIVMYEWCEWDGNSMSGWRSYGGTPHVTHLHVSSRPSYYAGWI